jgi:hypothetical protein
MENLEKVLFQMENSSDAVFRSKMGEIKFAINDLDAKISECKKRKYMIKLACNNVNSFADEGVYTCKVYNIRGGSYLIEKMTIPAVVLVQQVCMSVCL